MKTFTVKTKYGTYKNCTFATNKYIADESLAVEILTEDKEPLATITTCLVDKMLVKSESHMESYIDTNNCPWAVRLLDSLNIARLTGAVRQSGFCVYPTMLFDMEELKKYCEE